MKLKYLTKTVPIFLTLTVWLQKAISFYLFWHVISNYKPMLSLSINHFWCLSKQIQYDSDSYFFSIILNFFSIFFFTSVYTPIPRLFESFFYKGSAAKNLSERK